MDFLTPLLLNTAVAAITPLLLASLAGVLCGRAGIFNIALEGQMLVGAFAAVAGSFYSNSAWGGAAVAMVACVGFSLILAYGVTSFRGDAVVICIAMNLLASGMTAYLLREIFGVGGVFSDPAIVGFDKIRIGWIHSIPWVSSILSRQTAITYLSWLLLAIVTVIMFRTTIGLRLRGVGENGTAAQSMGVDVARYRVVTVLVAGALTGLAGTQLSLGGISMFAENMTAGRGWIAFVAVMLGRNNPVFAALVCVLFGLADAFSVSLQAQGLPNQITDVVPYLATMVVLVLTHRKRRSVARLTVASGG